MNLFRKCNVNILNTDNIKTNITNLRNIKREECWEKKYAVSIISFLQQGVQR